MRAVNAAKLRHDKDHGNVEFIIGYELGSLRGDIYIESETHSSNYRLTLPE